MVHTRKKVCPMGLLKVVRRGYHRKPYTRKSGVKVSGSYVPSTTFCIKDVGAKGKGKKLITIKRKGALKKLGYSTHSPIEKRREALKKAMKLYGKPTVFKMLQAQLVFRKRMDGARGVFEADRDWVVSKMSKGERKLMTQPARKKWMAMSPTERALAMPERKGV